MNKQTNKKLGSFFYLFHIFCSLFLVPAITIAGSTVITSIVGTAGLVALPTMAAGTLAPGTLAPGVMSTSIAAQPIMTASTALLAGNVFPFPSPLPPLT